MSSATVPNVDTPSPPKVPFGEDYFADSDALLRLPPFHARSSWDVLLTNALSYHELRGDAFSGKRKLLASLATAAQKVSSPMHMQSITERMNKERRYFASLVVNAVTRFWSVVQASLDATEEVELKDQRKKELYEKQISSLEYTENLLHNRINFKLGKGQLPSLRLLEKIGSGLRVYQKIGVEWLMSLHDQGICGILADEMGLGKTIQTIAFLAYLAEHRGDWGTHLIVVPMSIILNWENEFHRWAPAFNVLAYYGSVKERAEKRKGWDSNVHYNVVIVSYNTLLKDKRIFRRRKWHYLVLDEAHAIKSWETQRWQVLLDFTTEHRLLLSGTPLQNNPMELWSLLHFLMPESIVFESYEDFKALYGNPVVSLDVVHRLHQTLRPFVLRRLKCDVEKQLPKKIEKILLCPLSKRQRMLYDEYMALEETRKILASKDTLSILGVLMALRKVCNHPDLFQERPTETPYVLQNSIPKAYISCLPENLLVEGRNSQLTTWFSSGAVRHNSHSIQRIREGEKSLVIHGKPTPEIGLNLKCLEKYTHGLLESIETEQMHRVNNLMDRHRRSMTKLLSWSVLPILRVQSYTNLSEKVLLNHRRLSHDIPHCTTFNCVARNGTTATSTSPVLSGELTRFHLAKCISHPHRRMLQYDSGKLQTLAQLLPKLRQGGHRCLIFTQFTKVLNILEKFLTANALTYYRLDGSTPVRSRQLYVDTFNRSERIFAFILSTRSGGLGLNLVGADTVIFYDSDWNWSLDKQAQDRCHRIGQSRDVTIYRLISEHTVEEKILFRAREKRRMNNIVMRAGGFDKVSNDQPLVPDSEWKDSLLDFFHNFDEDHNDGRGVASRSEQFVACLQEVEDEEDALRHHETTVDETEKNESVLQYGVALRRKLTSHSTEKAGNLNERNDVHRVFYLRSAPNRTEGRLYALCMRFSTVIRVVLIKTLREKTFWFIELLWGVQHSLLADALIQNGLIETAQELQLKFPEQSYAHDQTSVSKGDKPSPKSSRATKICQSIEPIAEDSTAKNQETLHTASATTKSVKKGGRKRSR